MSPPISRRKCLNCKELFLPNCRGGKHQTYCLKPECRKARKRALQKAWSAKPANQDYFRDAENAKRAREWQKEHPGYWKETARYRRRTLQVGSLKQAPANQRVNGDSGVRTLQDLCSLQVPLSVGLISMLVGSTLQDDLIATTQKMVS